MRHLVTIALLIAALANSGPAAARSVAVSKPSDEEFVNALYRTYLGRDPDPSGIATYVGGLKYGQLTRSEVARAILDSPEYREVQARKAGGNGDPAKPETGTPADGADAPTGAVGDPQAIGDVPLEGYDSAKLHNPAHKTVKYLFGRVATRHSLAGVKDKEAAGRLLTSMLPELKASGLDIRQVDRDKILVKTDIGWEWVDVVRGAGSGSPGWWWGSEGKAISGPVPPPLPTTGNATGSLDDVFKTPPATPGTGTKTAGLPPPLASVPDLPEYKEAKIDTSSDERAVLTTAEYVKERYAHLFPHGDTANRDERKKCVDVMTVCIGVLRANGYDACRVLNHPSLPADDPVRYGSDAVVVNGNIYDIFGAMGEANKPQALNQGPYGNRKRE